MSQIPKGQMYRPIITGTPNVSRPQTTPVQTGGAQPQGQSFQELLNQSLKSQPLTFSKHAQQRTEQRGIQLGEEQIERLGSAVNMAQDKGLTQTLVMMDKNAFIVHVPNKVVVTVVDGNESNNAVFTNIDGAVFV